MEQEGQFVYRALDDGQNTIRLLTLLPGQFSDEVYLSISVASLSKEKRPPYECLSYTWGELHTPEKIYIRQDSPANVSKANSLQFMYPRVNLLNALKYLRLKDAPRLIWADAICIDQENITEKNQQIARMGQIYNYAAQVLVWLGPEDESTLMALETIERLSAGILITEDHRGCTTIPGSEAEGVERQFKESKLTSQHWRSLNCFIRRPWFERLWVRQEVQMATKVLVRCGHAEIEWGNIEKTIIFIEQKVSRLYFRIGDILRCRSLFPFLGSHSFCKCSDPRDLVYANLSTSAEMKMLQIRPDYSLNVAEIFKQMTYKYVQHFKNMEFFRLCDLKNLPPDFKSFVPNFAAEKPDSRLFSVYAHAGTRQSFVDTEGGNVQVKGRKAATIQGVSKAHKPLVQNTPSGDNYLVIVKTFHQWEPADLMTRTTYPSGNSGGGTLLDAFVMLLSNGFCIETYPRSPHLPTIEQSKASFLAAFWSGGDARLIENPQFKPYLGEVTSDRRGEVFFQTAEGYVGVAPTSDIKDGDIVAVLPGASVPIVLRPVGAHHHHHHYQQHYHQKDVSYQVVGPCYIQGIMFGELLLGPLPDGWLCVRDRPGKWYFRRQKQSNEKTTTTTTTATWDDPRLWPLPSRWQAHFCDFDGDDDGPRCDGACDELAYDEKNAQAGAEAGRVVEPWFFDTVSKGRSRDDPRLDVRGLEAGGIKLETFTLV